MEVKLTKLKCLRCSHEWYPNREELPRVCPKCKSPYWNVPRRISEVSNSKNKRRVS